MKPELQRISLLAPLGVAVSRTPAGPPVRFASYDVVRLCSHAEVECFLRAPGS